MNISDLMGGDAGEESSNRAPAAAPMNIKDLMVQQAPVPSPIPQAPMNIKDLMAGSDKFTMEPVNQDLQRIGHYIQDSPVGKVLDVLDVPGRTMAAGTVRVLDKTMLPGIQQKLMPEGGIAPDVHYSDVLNYMLPDPSTAPSDEIRSQYKIIRAGVGMAANVLGDPLFFLGPKFGQLTKASQELYQSGKVLEGAIPLERNLVEIRGGLAIPAQPIVDAGAKVAEKTAQAVEKIPGGKAAMEAGKVVAQTASDLVDSFNPWTGNLKTDVQLATHAATARGDEMAVVQWAKEVKAPKFTESENKLISAVIEDTPNISPDVAAEWHANVAFRDSAVRTPEGRLKTVYHGTTTNFDQYDLSKAKEGYYVKGIYFSEGKKIPTYFSQGQGTGNVRPAYLRITNPIDMDASLTKDTANKLAQAVMKSEFDLVHPDLPYGSKTEISNAILQKANKDVSVQNVLNSVMDRHHADHVLKLAGYDGFTAKEWGERIWGVFSNDQILSKFEMPKSALGLTAEEVVKHAYEAAPKAAKSLGVTVDGSRMEQLIDAAIKIKMENSMDFVERVKAGRTTVDNVGKSVIENYLVHKISPQAEAMLRGRPDLAAALEEGKLVQKMQQLSNGQRVSSYDPGSRFRSMRTTLEEANRIMEEKTGLKSFFIEDPVAATAVKRLETRKYLRDKQLLDVLSEQAVPREKLRKVKFGNQPEYLDSAGNRYAPIQHPDFEGKQFVIIDKESGKTVKFKQEDLLFPKRLADKVSYQILPRSTGNVAAFLDSYNRIFRGNALFRVDYHLENWLDNVLKNYINGVKLGDYVDTYQVLFNRPGMIEVKGQKVPVSQLKETMEKLNVMSQGHFSEASQLQKALFMGKKVSYEQGLLNKGKVALSNSAKTIENVFHGMNIIGEKGENFTRAAFMVSLLKRGYTPQMAAFEVEKWLFNFQRTTQSMDNVRRFVAPFAQAAIKTAQIAPGLIARKPYVMNFYENTLMKTLANAFNDPVDNWAVQKLYPEYFRLHDRVAGMLLPANHWLSILAGGGESKTGLPKTVMLGLPGGLGILNQFLVWDQTVQRQDTNISPQIRALSVLVAGKDPFSGQNIDLSKNSVDLARRLNYAIKTSVRGVIASPNLERWIYQKAGIGDPQYFDPAALMLWQSNFGKFARLTNLDKEYQFKVFALVSAEKELTRTLFSVLSKEASNRTLEGIDSEGIKKVFDSRPYSSAEVFAALTENHEKMMNTQLGREVLSDPTMRDPKVIVGLIKNLHQTIEELNFNYKTVSQEYLKATRGMRLEEIERMSDAYGKQLEQMLRQRFGQ